MTVTICPSCRAGYVDTAEGGTCSLCWVPLGVQVVRKPPVDLDRMDAQPWPSDGSRWHVSGRLDVESEDRPYGQRVADAYVEADAVFIAAAPSIRADLRDAVAELRRLRESERLGRAPRSALRAAFEKYAQHGSACTVDDCTCGLDETRKKLEEMR